MTPFTTLTARGAVLVADDVDTDQIIPARFLKGTSKVGLGVHLFADWKDLTFPAGAAILVTGKNFGCGSSREHAPWALVDKGFKAIIARSFADIFKENATKNGLLPIALGDSACVRIEREVREQPAATLFVDLPSQSVTLPDGTSYTFAIDPFAKHCLLNGIDELGYIQSFADQIAAYEERRG